MPGLCRHWPGHFHITKIWHILKRFSRALSWAQTSYFWIVPILWWMASSGFKENLGSLCWELIVQTTLIVIDFPTIFIFLHMWFLISCSIMTRIFCCQYQSWLIELCPPLLWNSNSQLYFHKDELNITRFLKL